MLDADETPDGGGGGDDIASRSAFTIIDALCLSGPPVNGLGLIFACGSHEQPAIRNVFWLGTGEAPDGDGSGGGSVFTAQLTIEADESPGGSSTGAVMISLFTVGAEELPDSGAGGNNGSGGIAEPFTICTDEVKGGGDGGGGVFAASFTVGAEEAPVRVGGDNNGASAALPTVDIDDCD